MSHGICSECYDGQLDVLNVLTLSDAQVDALPWGLVHVRGDGEILRFNSTEAALAHIDRDTVVGRHFFRDVAPCTQVQSFQGEFDRLRAAGLNGRAALTFEFGRVVKPVRVAVRLVYQASNDTAVMLISREAKATPAL